MAKNTKSVYVDPKECTGCEACVASTPNVFRMTSSGLAEVHNHAGDTQENIQEAIEACPVSCIHWRS